MINDQRTVPETNYNNNSASTTMTVFGARSLSIVCNRVHYTFGSNDTTPPHSQCSGTAEYLRRTFPASAVNIFYPAGGSRLDFDKNLGQREKWNDLLLDVTWRNVWDFTNYDSGDVEIWYGLVPSSISGSGISGLAWIGGKESIGKANNGSTMAQEVGHNLGRLHAPCGDPDGPDPDFPQDDGSIGDYGIDYLSGAFYNKNDTYDFMSYCRPTWISAYTYASLFGKFYLFGPSEPLSERDYLAVAGTYNAISNTAELAQAYSLAMPEQEEYERAGEGELRLDVLDSQGNALFSRSFAPMHHVGASGADEGERIWLEVLPLLPGATSIQLVHDGEVLASRTASANPPQVTLEAPTAGGEFPESLEVRWSASDPDGDALVFSIQYSTDGGESWSAAAVNLSGSSYTLDTTEMAGSSGAKIRIAASDGFHTAYAESQEPFSIPSKAPIPNILWPADGSDVPSGIPILLQGTASDLEEGLMSEEQMVWSSDRQGELGSGEYINAENLLPGWHQITLTVTDRSGMSAQVSIWVHVGLRLHLPLTMK